MYAKRTLIQEYRGSIKERARYKINQIARSSQKSK